MEPFADAGISVYGVDASEYAVNNPISDELNLEKHDLTEPLHIEKEGSLVLCIEVLEHLPKDGADTAVQTITKAAPIAIVTAAPPGQGGDYHVNEQPDAYWINKFKKHGMKYEKEETENLKSKINADELDWLNQNIMVYKQAE